MVEPGSAEQQLYLSHRAALVDYATPIVGCRSRAEDVVQEAFIRFGRRRKEPIVRPVSYLYRIVRNLALDWRRHPEASVEAVDPVNLDRLPSAATTPERAAIDRDQLRVLAEALCELPERTRIAFNMHRLEGRSLKEIADHLGVSVVRAHQLARDAIRHGAERLDADD